MSKTRYFASRLAQTVVLLFIVLAFLFFLFRLMPGDYTDIMLQRGASLEAIRAFEEAYGLNDPLHIQFIRYMINFMSLDIGNSLQYGIPVWEYVSQSIFNTLILVAPGVTAAYLLGGIFGSVLGSNRGKWIEKLGVMGAVTVGAFPGFFIAILMILIFSGFLGIFPSGGLASGNTLAQYGSRSGINWGLYFTSDFAWHYILPFATVVLRFFYTPTLTMRTSVNEVSNQDFMYYHKISGLPGLSRLRRLIRHASLPVITLYPVSMTRAISGLVLIEMVFNWPGIGFTLVQSVFARDYPVVQFVFFITAVVVIFGNLLIDILYGVIDPRVTLGEGES